MFHTLVAVDLGPLLPFLGMAAVSIAVLGSIEALMTSVSLSTITNENVDANRELLGQGLGNLLSSAFGGMAAAGAIGPSKANLSAGGWSRASGLACSALMLAPPLSYRRFR